MSASTLPTLPPEVWVLIYCQFCPHCSSGETPDFEDPEYKAGKSTLSALSLTSQATRDLSQPVMYHCFHQNSHRNKLWKFLRTLLTKPQLAKHVRVLSLPGGTPGSIEYCVRRDVKSWEKASVDIGTHVPGWVTQALSGSGHPKFPTFDGADEDSRLGYHDPEVIPLGTMYIRSDLNWWHQHLTLAYCSKGLTHLAIHQICGPSACAEMSTVFPRQLWPTPQVERALHFPRLRVLSIEIARHHQDVHWFFSQAPCLKYIGVGLLYTDDDVPASTSWTPPEAFTSVNALSISAGAFHQGYMVRLCNQIRDLELHLSIPATGTTPWDPLSGWEVARKGASEVWDAWPTSVKQQLRRLRLSSGVAFRERRQDGSITPGNHDKERGVVVSPPLTEFQSLEVLETDQASLNVCLMRGLDPGTSQEEVFRQLPTCLPSSLQVLRIFHFELFPWSLLLLELEELASAKLWALPKLSVIQIDINLHPPHFRQGLPAGHRKLPEAMRVLGVVRAMKDVGIELRFSLNGTYSHRHGFLNPLPGCLGGFASIAW